MSDEYLAQNGVLNMDKAILDAEKARKVIRAYNMGFNLGNAFKYMVRQGKDKAATKQDLEKAIQYIRFAIEEME
jgi:hypothetical protein